MRILEAFRRPSVFVMLLASILCIMLVPIAANITVAISSQMVLNSQIETSSKEKFDTYTRKIDQIFSSIYSTAYNIASDNTITDYLKKAGRSYYTEYEIRLHLDTYNRGDSAISLCYIYIPRYDYVLYTGGGASSRYFYKERYDFGYEEWVGALNVTTNNIVTKHWSIMALGGHSNSVVLKTLSSNAANKVSAVVVVQLDNLKINKEISKLGLKEYNGIVLLNQAGIMASTLSDEESAIIYAYSISGNLKSHDMITVNQTNYQILTQSLDRYGITVVSTTATSLFARQNSYIRYVGIYSIFFCLLLTILLGVIFSRNHAMRIHKIMTLIKRQPENDAQPSEDSLELDALQTGSAKSALEAGRPKNEYVAIEMMVRNTMRNYSTLTSIVGEYSGKLMVSFFENVLLGAETDAGIIQETFRLYGHRMPGPNFAIILCSRQDEKVRSVIAGTQDQVTLTLSVISEAAHRVFTGTETVYTGYVQNTFATIANFVFLPASIAQSGIVAFEEVLMNTLGAQGDTYCVGHSDLYTNISDTHTAYKRVKDAMAQENVNHPENPNKVPDWIATCRKMIVTHYADKDLSTSYLSEKLKLSRPYLSMYFKQFTGNGLHDEIQRYRVQQAKWLLLEKPEITMTEISDMTGFSSVESFIRNFKKYEGTTPGRLRGQSDI